MKCKCIAFENINGRFHKVIDDFEGVQWIGCLCCHQTWFVGGEEE